MGSTKPSANPHNLLLAVGGAAAIAQTGILNGNSEAVRALTERDRAIDSLYPEIEELLRAELVGRGRPLGDWQVLPRAP